jgi:hypothetical protein
VSEKADNVCYRPSKTLLVALFCVLAGVLFVAAIPTAWATPVSQDPTDPLAIPTCPPSTIPVTNVSITGPTRGVPNVVYPFTAVITPTDVTSPTFRWFPWPNTGQDTPNVTYVWPMPGNKRIIVVVLNPLNPWVCGLAADSHDIAIPYKVQLPVINKH